MHDTWHGGIVCCFVVHFLLNNKPPGSLEVEYLEGVTPDGAVKDVY